MASRSRSTREKHLRWLGSAFPRYLEAYESAYATRVYLGGGYRRRLDALLERLRERHGFARAWSEESAAEPPRKAEQIALWA